MKTKWLARHYFEIVSEVVDAVALGSSCAARGQLSESVESESRASIGVSDVGLLAPSSLSPVPKVRERRLASVRAADVFASPKKRVRSESSQIDVSRTQPITVTVAECHARDTSRSDAVLLKVAVLDFPAEPRWVTVTDKKSKAEEKVAVVSILVADATGPIAFEIWRNPAETVLQNLIAWSAATEETVWVEMQYLWSRAEFGACIPPTRKLVGHERTSVVECAPVHVSEVATPADMLYCKDFAKLSAQLPPFTVSIIGIVTTLDEEEMTSQSGLPMKSFRLQDQSGRYVRCTVCGRHVDNVALRANNEVILFFAKALPGLRGDPGSLWVYDSSHIVLRRQGCQPPSARVCMELR